ncbi:lipase [Bacillus sp. AFS015802]|uniref:alpha/beta fold hydrolase n=1 Tax=Bacillus sp. AFS015802 TaxID=2033486 RepID=UPI000BF5BE82|nr:alpha/beta hydrolase [Bacillus sp. AFS015802]PFA67173.1 lipase [Bacillus sp. AFS015802]
MKRYFIQIRNRHIHITEWGKPDKPIIFCLHGLGSTGLSFIEIAHVLKDEYRIISIDAPGHGKTTPFERGEEYEMNKMADWLNEVIEVLEIESFYFLSHSWGSFVSLFYAVKYPERIRDCILIDGGYQGKRHSKQSVEEEVAYYEDDFEQVWETWDDFLDLVKSETLNWTSLKMEAAKDLALCSHHHYHWHARGKTAAHIIRAMHKDEAEDIFHKIESSVLLLRATLPEGQEDNRKKTADIFKEKTGGEVRSILKTTHLLHWDRPEIVVEEIRKRWG